jgi:hypothetical protein
MSEQTLCLVEITVGVAGICYALWSDRKRRTERNWIHVALVNLKPSIDGPRAPEILKAINNMLEFLKPPKKQT